MGWGGRGGWVAVVGAVDHSSEKRNRYSSSGTRKNSRLIYIYIKRINVMQLGSMFICNCNIAVHVSDAFCVHLQEHLEIVDAASGE